MRAKTLDGHDIDLKPQVFNSLKTRLRRPLLAPWNPGYEASRTVCNSLIDRSPPFAGKASPELTLVALLRRLFGAPLHSAASRTAAWLPSHFIQPLLDGEAFSTCGKGPPGREAPVWMSKLGCFDILLIVTTFLL